MNVAIENLGNTSIRVIIDHDTINDTVLEAGAMDTFRSDAEGIIELRELGVAPGEEDGASEDVEHN